MPLTFPTLAEQCRDRFLTSKKTVSLSTLARRMKAQREDDYPRRIFIFEDDTRLVLTGTGRSLKIEAQLP